MRTPPLCSGPVGLGAKRTRTDFSIEFSLEAKRHNGTFVLRIEDTDQNRYVAGAEKYIIDALNWCQIPFDEGPGKEGDFGPYKQSERKEIYKKYIDVLIKKRTTYGTPLFILSFVSFSVKTKEFTSLPLVLLCQL